MSKSLLAFTLLAAVILSLALLTLAQHDERRSDPLFIDAHYPEQPGLCIPLPTPLDRPKRALDAKLGDA